MVAVTVVRFCEGAEFTVVVLDSVAVAVVRFPLREGDGLGRVRDGRVAVAERSAEADAVRPSEEAVTDRSELCVAADGDGVGGGVGVRVADGPLAVCSEDVDGLTEGDAVVERTVAVCSDESDAEADALTVPFSALMEDVLEAHRPETVAELLGRTALAVTVPALRDAPSFEIDFDALGVRGSACCCEHCDGGCCGVMLTFG